MVRGMTRSVIGVTVVIVGGAAACHLLRDL